MNLIHTAAISVNQTPMQWNDNLAHIRAAIRAASAQGACVLCLPELCLSGYGCEDAFLGSGLLSQAQRSLRALIADSRGLIIAVGLPWVHRNRVYNAVCLLVDGRIAGFVAKRFLAGDGIHYEPRWFHAWPLGVRELTWFDGQSYPMGDIYFELSGVRIGFEICEEAWVADRPGIRLARLGVDIILNPSASHFAFGKHAVRERFVLEGSRAFSAAYVYTNLLGNEAGRVIYDGDTLIAANGQLLTRGRRFSFHDWQVTSAVIDISQTRMTQARTSTFVPNPEGCVSLPFVFPALQPCDAPATYFDLPAWERGDYLKEEEFTRAEALGLFDYLRKSGAQSYVVSLSGGADSSSIACLVRFMVQLAFAELGEAGMREKLPFLPATLHQVATFTSYLLACVYQATANSSATTRNAAAELAHALDATFVEWDLEPIVQGYVQRVGQAIGRALTWEQDDLALQNIQARTRSPGVWMLANMRNALLLSTSNRSEAAVGYATMDGDTSGGLSPLAGIDKHFLRHWLRWVETQGPEALGTVAALRLVNAQQPTAELRPGQTQTDEQDLMPYQLLAALERAAIHDRRTPEEIYCLLKVDFPAFTDAQRALWIDRFFRLWSRNQWKRERYAPAFHLDDFNLDPRSWCRFPILTGGFHHELMLMWQRAKVDGVNNPHAPVILLPGWSFDSSVWCEVAAALSARWQVICLDLPGHGGSPVRYFPRQLQAVCAMLAVQVSTPAIWIGWSLGGMVALAMAHFFPSLTQGVGMVAAGPRFTQAQDWPWAMPLATLRAFQQEFYRQADKTMQRFISLQAHNTSELRLLRTLHRQVTPTDHQVLADGLEALASWDLRAVQYAPWLCLGQQDRLLPVALGEHWKVAHLVEIEQAGHAPFITHPQLFVQQLEAYLYAQTR